MNKNYTFILAILLIGSLTKVHGQLTCFEAEGALYNEAMGGTPGSGAEFYSQAWGGQLVFTEIFDAEGKVVFHADIDNQPAFVLNTLKTKGTGKVMFMEEKDFSFNNFLIETDGSIAILRWIAAIKENINISFIVQQSKDGNHFADISTIGGQVAENKIGYESEIGNCVTGMLYRIKIFDQTTNKVRYLSTPKMSPCSKSLVLYSSISSSDVTVIYEEFAGDDKYNIVDSQGKILKKGQLKSVTTQFDVSDLPVGVYIFHVSNGANQKTARFIKK